MATSPAAADMIDPVIRLPHIVRPREEIEAALGVALDRFEPYRRGGVGQYGQLNPPIDGGWAGLASLLAKVGPGLRACVARGDMGTPEVDVGRTVAVDIAASSLRVPNAVLSAIAEFGLDLVVSTYVGNVTQ